MKKQEQYERATIKLKNQQLLQNWSIFATVYISAIEKIPTQNGWYVGMQFGLIGYIRLQFVHKSLKQIQ